MKTDKFISLLGKIINVGDNSFTLDDGTGKLQIDSEHAVRTNEIVRVFCSLDNQWKADIIQDMAGMDLNIYKKVEELYSRAGL